MCCNVFSSSKACATITQAPTHMQTLAKRMLVVRMMGKKMLKMQQEQQQSRYSKFEQQTVAW